MGINKEILRLALPSILANITVPFVGMVDIAVAGHLSASGGAASLIGGIAIGTMLFDLLYWNFGFLRVSTGGMTAQAYGRGDYRECGSTLVRSAALAMMIAMALIVIQWVFLKAAFLVVKCSPEVRTLAEQYFLIRIWAAPATLSLMAFKGWFIGMQDSVSAMTTDLVVNGVNIAGSIILALGTSAVGLGEWKGLGFAGVAWGTVLAQYSGLVTALLFVAFKYARKVFAGFGKADLQGSFRGAQTRKFFSMNGDVFVRSLCFIAIYIGYTIISARYGDVLLASCSIMMKLLMIFSYFTDGFAYAGEAMTGKYIGAANRPMLDLTVKWIFVWCAGLAAAFMFIYGFGGIALLRIMTSDPTVITASRKFILWLLLMPVAGCAAFTWDGIFIGATDSKATRNSMLWATVSFFAVWFAGIALANGAGDAAATFDGTAAVLGGMATVSDGPAAFVIGDATAYGITAVHILMGAYFAHLLARSIYLTVRWRGDF